MTLLTIYPVTRNSFQTRIPKTVGGSPGSQCPNPLKRKVEFCNHFHLGKRFIATGRGIAIKGMPLIFLVIKLLSVVRLEVWILF